jgi:hypothetical protein
VKFLAETLRFSAFTPIPLDYRKAPVDQWWRLAAKADPDQVSITAASLHAVAEGPFSKGRLTLAASPGRVDWQQGPSTPPTDHDQWLSIGNWPECIQEFIPPLLEWLPTFTPINRLAFGAVVVSSIPDREAGYRVLESALSELQLKLTPDMSDFLLQFNRPVPSQRGPAGMAINRLSRWSVALLQPIWVQVAVTGASPPTVSTDRSRAESHAVRIELDFNTAAGWSQNIADEQSRALLTELTQSAIEFLEERLT